MSCDVELILQPFHHFTYITAHSPILPSLYLRHSSFSNPSFATPTSQALYLRHLANRPCSPIYTAYSIQMINFSFSSFLPCFLSLLFTLNPGPRKQMPVSQMRIREPQNMGQNIRQRQATHSRASLNLRSVIRMSGSPRKTTQNIIQKDETRPVPGQRLKSVTRRESNRGRRVGRQGFYRRRYSDGYTFFLKTFISGGYIFYKF